MTSPCKKSLVSKNREFIFFLSHSPPRERCKVIGAVEGERINTISEIFQNFLKKNITEKKDVIQKLKRYRKEVKKVSSRKTPIYMKKKILQSRKGGAILSVLLPLAAGLISTILK